MKSIRLCLIACCFLFVSCSSIPLSSLVKLATFGEKGFLSIKPEEVKARLTLNGDARLSIDDIKLILSFEFTDKEVSKYQFTLKLLNEETIEVEKKWYRKVSTKYQYEFQINDDSIEDFKKYQIEFAKYGKPKHYNWDVFYGLIKTPPAGEPLDLDMELKFSKEDDYFYLFNGAEVDINLN